MLYLVKVFVPYFLDMITRNTIIWFISLLEYKCFIKHKSNTIAQLSNLKILKHNQDNFAGITFMDGCFVGGY